MPEEEVRLMSLPGGGPHEVPFAPSLLQRVILGRKMRDKDRKTIREWCSKRVPSVLVQEEDAGVLAVAV